MKKILFPTDFSDNANNALKFILDWTAGEEIQLTVLHCFNIRATSSEINSYEVPRELDEIEEKTKEILKNLVEEINSDHPNVKASYDIKPGIPNSTIVSTAEELNVDYIVLGTQGASGIDKTLFGSVAAGVVEDAPFPVFAIPHDCQFNGFSSIVYATDYKLHDLQLINKAIEFASFYKSQLLFAHVSTNKYDTNELLEWFSTVVSQQAEYDKIDFKLTQHDHPVKGIDELIKAENADLLMMNTQKRSGFLERLFNKSITKEMAYATTVPLLAFHKEDLK